MRLNAALLSLIGAGILLIGAVGRLLEPDPSGSEFAIRCDDRGGMVYVSEHLPKEQTCLMFTGNSAVVLLREPL